MLLLLAFAIFYKTNKKIERKRVESTVDGEMYLVHKNKKSDAEIESANKLARVNEKIDILIKSLSTSDERRQLLEEAPIQLQEREYLDKTGYTINKGDTVGLCLEEDENSLFFVTLHELSHIITKEYGHPPEFWNNFKFLVKKAVDIGLYNYRDYNTSPINYCDRTISYTPYKK